MGLKSQIYERAKHGRIEAEPPIKRECLSYMRRYNKILSAPIISPHLVPDAEMLSPYCFLKNMKKMLSRGV